MDGVCFVLSAIWLAVMLTLVMRDDIEEDDDDES